MQARARPPIFRRRLYIRIRLASAPEFFGLRLASAPDFSASDLLRPPNFRPPTFRPPILFAPGTWPSGCPVIVAIFYPFSQFCEIDISLLSLQKQPNTAPNLFQRGVEYGKYASLSLAGSSREGLEVVQFRSAHLLWRTGYLLSQCLLCQTPCWFRAVGAANSNSSNTNNSNNSSKWIEQ